MSLSCHQTRWVGYLTCKPSAIRARRTFKGGSLLIVSRPFDNHVLTKDWNVSAWVTLHLYIMAFHAALNVWSLCRRALCLVLRRRDRGQVMLVRWHHTFANSLTYVSFLSDKSSALLLKNSRWALVDLIPWRVFIAGDSHYMAMPSRTSQSEERRAVYKNNQ